MSGVPKDITGRRYGRLVAVRRTDEKDRGGKGSWIWECKCDCGKIVFYSVSRLTQGVKSCGCLWEEEIRKSNKAKGPRKKDMEKPGSYIFWNKARRKYQVVTPSGYVGVYQTLEEAEEARNASLIGLPVEVVDWLKETKTKIRDIVISEYERRKA